MVFCCSLAISQTSSLTVQTGAQGIALGEGLVALPQNEAALMYNPASLAGIEGVHFSWSYRPQKSSDWFEGFDINSYYRSFTLSIGTPYLNVGVMYNMFRRETSIDWFGTRGRTFTNQTIAVGAAYSFPCNVSVGATVKSVLYNDGYYPHPASVEGPTLLDAGVLYTAPGFVKAERKGDRFSLGLSLQNFGGITRYSYTDANYSFSTQEPRHLRVGTSYEYFSFPREGRRLSPFGLLVVAEYRRILNDVAPSDQRDFSGVGFEARIYEIVSLRLGFYNLHSEHSDAATRYGAGVHAPLQKLGIDVPLEFKAEYGALSLPTNSGYVPHVFSVGVAYTSPLFEQLP